MQLCLGCESPRERRRSNEKIIIRRGKKGGKWEDNKRKDPQQYIAVHKNGDESGGLLYLLSLRAYRVRYDIYEVRGISWNILSISLHTGRRKEVEILILYIA